MWVETLQAVGDLLAFVERALVAWGGVRFGDDLLAAYVYLAPFLGIPGGIIRQWHKNRLVSIALIGVFVYLAYNRLTLFNDVQLTHGSFLGNVSFTALGIGLACGRLRLRLGRRRKVVASD